jgi:stringent starvation protein B
MSTPDNQGSSTRPYLLRALHEWCTDNGFTPYIAVHVDASVQVPPEYVKNNEIVLNIGFEATSALQLGNQFIEFKARFGGVPRAIVVPVDHVVAIYARENGQGMAFPVPAAASEGGPRAEGSSGAAAPGAGTAGAAGRPLQRAPRRADEPPRRGPAGAGSAGKASPSSPAPADAARKPPGPPGPPQPSGPPEPPEPPGPRPSLKRIK